MLFERIMASYLVMVVITIVRNWFKLKKITLQDTYDALHKAHPEGDYLWSNTLILKALYCITFITVDLEDAVKWPASMFHDLKMMVKTYQVKKRLKEIREKYRD